MTRVAELSADGGPVLGVRSRVTVHVQGRSVDVVVPTAEPVAGWMTSLMKAALSADDAAAGGWRLSRTTGDLVPMDRSLAEIGVLDGETLYLDQRSWAVPMIVIQDVVEQVSSGEQPRMTLPARRRVFLPAAAVSALVALVIAVVAGRGDPYGTGTALAGVTLLGLLMAWLSDRKLEDDVAAAVIAAVSTVYAAAAGALLTISTGTDVLGIVIGAAMVALLGQLTLASCGSWPRAFATAVAWALIPLEIACIGSQLLGYGLGEAAGITVVILTLALPSVPRASGWLAGLTLLPFADEKLRAPAHRPASLDSGSMTLAERVEHARRLMALFLMTSCLTLLAGWAVVVSELRQPWAAIFVVVSVIAVMCRARAHQHVRDIAVLLITGLIALAALGTLGLISQGMASMQGVSPAVVAGVPLLLAMVMLINGLDVFLAVPQVATRRAIRAIDLIARILSLPLFLAACGLMHWAFGVGVGFGD